MVESLDVESGIEIGHSFGLSGGCVEIKIEVSSGESERVDSGVRVDMVEGLLALGADAVAVAEVVARASAIRPGVIYYRTSGQ